MKSDITEQEKKTFNQASINDNKIVSEQPEHGIYSSKVLWQKQFFCSEPGCQQKTYLTRRINMSIMAKLFKTEPVDYFQPLCEEHFQITHGSGIVAMSEVNSL